MIFLAYMFIGNVICVDLLVHHVKRKEHLVVPIVASVINSTFENAGEIGSREISQSIETFVKVARSFFGKIDLEEVKFGLEKKLEDVMEAGDRDDNGEIDIKHSFEPLDVMPAADIDGNGEIDIVEFTFFLLDLDSSGKISLKELQDVHTDLPLKILQKLIDVSDHIGYKYKEQIPDGMIDFDELVGMQQSASLSLFSEVDTNDNGYLELDEVEASDFVIKANDFMEAHDKDSNGAIDIDEAAFGGFDSDLDGDVSLQEMEGRLKKMEDELCLHLADAEHVNCSQVISLDGNYCVNEVNRQYCRQSCCNHRNKKK